MPAFSYEAVDAIGTAKKGVVNADSARAARADLRAQGLVPIAVDTIAAQLDETGHTKTRAFGDHLSAVELSLFTRQLARACRQRTGAGSAITIIEINQ